MGGRREEEKGGGEGRKGEGRSKKRMEEEGRTEVKKKEMKGREWKLKIGTGERGNAAHRETAKSRVEI